ncbi:MAG: ankyrin repeat domain-containing protein, partial [Limisphaerales bacterium]
AATAIFRLGECYRKQGKTEEANKQYQRILAEFRDQTQLVDVSRNYLPSKPNKTTPPSAQPTEDAALIGQLRSLSVDTAQAEGLWKSANRLQLEDRIKFFTSIQPDQLMIDLVNKRFEVRAKLNELRAQYGQQTPQYKAQEENVKATEQQLSERAETLVWSLEQKYKMLKDQEDSLKSRLNENTGPVAKTTEPTTTSEEDEEIRKIKEMIQNSPDLINVAVNSDEGTPLQQACTKGHLKVAEFLLANGADMNIRTEKVSPPLICAAVHGHKALIDLLLSKGADIETKSTDTYNKQTALMCAAFRGFKTLTQTLLAHGANINATDTTGRTSLHRAVENGYFEIAELLLTNKAPVDATTLEKKTPLHLASDSDNVEVVKVLVEHGADVNAKSDGGFTPLLNAAEHGKLTIASFLLEHGANTEDAVSENWNQHDFRGFRPINFAILRHDATLLKVLLEHHANPNSRFTRQSSQDAWPGAFPLLTAYNNAELLEILLEHGADPNLADDTGNTALHWAVSNQQKRNVELLIAHGANVNATDKQGAPPIGNVRGATKGNAGEIRQMLLKAGANENFVRLKQISVRRNGQDTVIFTKGSNDWNHFTLYELISVVYGRNQYPSEGAPVFQPALRSIPAMPMRSLGSSPGIPLNTVWQMGGGLARPDLQFPDFTRLVIKRIIANPLERLNHVRVDSINTGVAGQEKIYHVDLENLLQSTDFGNDVQLEWGDIVEVPEQDHPINAQWAGLTTETQRKLMQLLARNIQIDIKGISTNLTVMPPMPKFSDTAIARANFQNWLKPTLPANSIVKLPDNYIVSSFGLREVINTIGILRSSSDTTRVKIVRAQNANVRNITVNLNEGEEPWIEPGDVIEIPDRDSPSAPAQPGQ